MRPAKYIYIALLIGIIFLSYMFVDYNFPIASGSLVWKLVSVSSPLKTLMYIAMVSVLYICYGFVLWKIHRNHLTPKQLWNIIWITVGLLVFSFPAFSYDIFNYIATAKVAFFYKENPYVVMPIEISTEPLLAFMHAANKTALYGPSWILMTSIPYFLGLKNIYLTVFLFKLFVALWYVGTCFLVWTMTGKNKIALALFALNPLVIIESLVSGHNDMVMMFFALLSFYLLRKEIFILSFSSLIISILVKYATVILLPFYIFAFVAIVAQKKVNWDKIWYYSFMSLGIVFLLSPLREELYSWYFIWPFSFLVLTKNKHLFKLVCVAFSLGLLLRFAPFIYSKNWAGLTPNIKLIVTTLSPLVGLLLYPLYRKVAK